jgi:hypothetical protein
MDSITAFYNGRKGENSTLIVSTALSIAGFLFLSLKIFSFVRLLLSIFVLPGKSVSSSQLQPLKGSH